MGECRHTSTTHIQESLVLTASVIRGRYGEISYAKSWCGFPHLNRDGTKGPYKTWRDQIKAYITALSWKPGSLTDNQLESVIIFARSLPPVKSQIARIKNKHRPEDVAEVERQIRHLVRDICRKLQATMDRLKAERGEAGLDAEDTEYQSRFSSPSTACFAILRLVLTNFSSGSMRLGFSLLPKGDKAPHCSSDGRS